MVPALLTEVTVSCSQKKGLRWTGVVQELVTLATHVNVRIRTSGTSTAHIGKTTARILECLATGCSPTVGRLVDFVVVSAVLTMEPSIP